MHYTKFMFDVTVSLLLLLFSIGLIQFIGEQLYNTWTWWRSEEEPDEERGPDNEKFNVYVPDTNQMEEHGGNLPKHRQQLVKGESFLVKTLQQVESCCHIGCNKKADFICFYSENNEDYSTFCHDHVETYITDFTTAVYTIKGVMYGRNNVGPGPSAKKPYPMDIIERCKKATKSFEKPDEWTIDVYLERQQFDAIIKNCTETKKNFVVSEKELPDVYEVIFTDGITLRVPEKEDRYWTGNDKGKIIIVARWWGPDHKRTEEHEDRVLYRNNTFFNFFNAEK